MDIDAQLNHITTSIHGFHQRVTWIISKGNVRWRALKRALTEEDLYIACACLEDLYGRGTVEHLLDNAEQGRFVIAAMTRVYLELGKSFYPIVLDKGWDVAVEGYGASLRKSIITTMIHEAVTVEFESFGGYKEPDYVEGETIFWQRLISYIDFMGGGDRDLILRSMLVDYGPEGTVIRPSDVTLN